jgi:putative acetyltransferase
MITIRPAARPTDDIRALIAELDAELGAHYTPEQRHGLSLDGIFQSHIAFFTATHNGTPAGCGGIAIFETFAELKRMYVRPAFRGTGVALALLATLTETAAAKAVPRLRLETGTSQHAAIRFYERAGFRPCPSFPPYDSMPPAAIATSLFYEKPLV